jgi:hypothetical protein
VYDCSLPRNARTLSHSLPRVPCTSRIYLCQRLIRLPIFLANGSKPKYAQIKEGINFGCNNTCKYINTKTIPGISVTREALIGNTVVKRIFIVRIISCLPGINQLVQIIRLLDVFVGISYMLMFIVTELYIEVSNRVHVHVFSILTSPVWTIRSLTDNLWVISIFVR